MSVRPPDRELLDHLVVEFGDHGRRTVEFIDTAHLLLSHAGLSESPRLAETIAYCLREAMKSIPDSQAGVENSAWRQASRAVVRARDQYERIRGVLGEDEEGALRNLLGSINDLEEVHQQQGIHQRRLIEIFLRRTGAAPLAAGTSPIEHYQDLLSSLDRSLHSEVTLVEAEAMWERCQATLRQFFLPPDARYRELDRLASVEQPSRNDVDELIPLLVAPNHVEQFLNKISTPAWLTALDHTRLLDPPGEDGTGWPVIRVVARLREEHDQDLFEWLVTVAQRFEGVAAQSCYVAIAALGLGSTGKSLVLDCIRRHRTSARYLSLALRLVESAEPSDPIVEEVADLALNADSWSAMEYVDPVLAALSEGTTAETAERRVRLLCWKLQASDPGDSGLLRLKFDAGGSIADQRDFGGRERLRLTLKALLDVTKKAWPWLSIDDLLIEIDRLPDGVRQRTRSWLVGNAPSVGVETLIDEVEQALSDRFPSGDDLVLIDRVVMECDETVYVGRWQASLGDPPLPGDVAAAMAQDSLTNHDDWLRAYAWFDLLPISVTARWTPAIQVIAADWGISSRESLERPREVHAAFGSSPIAREDLQDLSPIEAARMIGRWRREPNDYLTDPYMLARTLKDLVEADPDGWLSAPLEIATSLKHPTYLRYYLEGAASAVESAQSPPVSDLVDVVEVVRAHPWEVSHLGGSPGLDYDADWDGVEQAAVTLITALARANAGFAGRDDDVWAYVQARVEDGGTDSAVGGGDVDPLKHAINTPASKALEAALAIMGQSFRTTDSVTPTSLDLLDRLLALEGAIGGHHRAIIATRLGFLKHVAPDWLDDRAELLIGSAAPEDMAQLTVDMAIKWARPNQWVLEGARSRVRDAVQRDVRDALEHLLVATLLRLNGYGVDETVGYLRSVPGLLATAGERLGRMLRNEDEPDHVIAAAREFWSAAIETGDRAALASFGTMAEIVNLDDATWLELLHHTLELTDGKTDWAPRIADRLVGLPASVQAVDSMNLLLRGAADEWGHRRVLEAAQTMLTSASELSGSPEYGRLQTALRERGVL